MSKEAETWVWNNSRTNGNDRLVLLYLADQGSDDGTNSFPSIQRIADKCNVDKDTVRRVLLRLESANEILIERPEQQGRGWFNRYTLVMGRPVDVVRELAAKARDLRPFAGRTPETRKQSATREERAETGSKKVVEGGGRAAQLGVIPIDPLIPATTTPLGDLPAADRRPEPGSDDDPEFLAFWAAYPLKKDKGGSRKAWRSAVKKAPVGLIIDGAHRFAGDANLPEPAYIPHPKTWLNGERWNDGPLPSRIRRSVPRDGTEAVLDEVLDGMRAGQ